MNKECTRHYWCTFWEFYQIGEVQAPLSNLHLGLLPLVGHGITLMRALILVLGAVLSKMSHIAAGETAVTICRVRQQWKVGLRCLRLETRETRYCR